MEEEKKLYPFRMIPIAGSEGENVQIADMGYLDSRIRNGWLAANSLSEVMDMYMDRVVGEQLFAAYGRQFPLLVRTLDTETAALPLMVCPDDSTATERYDFLGKTKMWYVLSVSDDARMDLGFRDDVESAEFYAACRHGEVEPLLHSFRPKAGESFLVRPGTVHSARGVKLLEVAQSSPLDFKIFGWGKAMGGDEFDESLNLEAAFDFIDYRKYEAVQAQAPAGEGRVRLASCNLFTVTLLDLKSPLDIKPGAQNGFSAYTCIKGSAMVRPPKGENEIEAAALKEGESVIVPAEVGEFFLVPASGDTVLVESIVQNVTGLN